MELKVWVEGIQRIVCGVTEKTTCQDVVYALAHATGKTGRFTLIERWRNNERLLAPQEHPVKVLNKWGEYSQDVQFILQRSSLEGAKGNQGPPNGQSNPAGSYRSGPMATGDIQRINYPAQGTVRPPLTSTAAHLSKSQNQEPAAVWKPPPPHHSGAGLPPAANPAYGIRKGHGYPISSNPEVNARLSPDSGRGSDKTGSDTSNSYTDKDNVKNNNSNKKHAASSQPPFIPSTMNGGYGMGPPNNNYQTSASTSQLLWRLPPPSNGEESPYGFSKQVSMPALKQQPPAYKPPPHPQPGPSSSSPADPPPYRNPPPPPGAARFRGPPTASSPSHGYHPSPPPPQGNQIIRPPHYSPPPTHRVSHLSRHPSKTSLAGGLGTSSGIQSGQFRQRPSAQQMQQTYHRGRQVNPNGPPTDMTELLNLVTAQQSTLQAQQADIRQFEIEEAGFADHGGAANSQPQQQHVSAPDGPVNGQQAPPLLSPGSQLDLVLSEVRRLEELSFRNDDELKFLNSERAQLDQAGAGDEGSIRGEIMQLKQRLAGTDVELQRTNTTLRRLGDEMRNMSLEKSRQREQELIQEMERLQSEIKSLQKSSEDSANISQQLSKDVKDIEDQIRQRKSEVEQLIKEMREANMESLAISPPEESKQFLDGPPKPGTSRKMMGSPRQLENAVPTSRNPHGVWV